jgi:hypothetical protein
VSRPRGACGGQRGSRASQPRGFCVGRHKGLCRTAAPDSGAGRLCRPPRGCVRRRPLSWPRGSCVGSCVGRGAALESAAGLLCRTAGRRAHKDGNKNPSSNLVDYGLCVETGMSVSAAGLLCRPRKGCVGRRRLSRPQRASTGYGKKDPSANLAN